MVLTSFIFRNRSGCSLLVAFAILVCSSGLLLPGEALNAQTSPSIEPEIRSPSAPEGPLDYDKRYGATVNIGLTNYGFALGGQFIRVLDNNTELLFRAQIGTLKDSREQSFFFFGQEIIPNKYNRVMNFPVMAGLRQRLLANAIDDSFRIYASGLAGMSFSFVYPYFEDRPFPQADDPPAQVQLPDSRINDVFQGWGDGDWEIGYAGQIGLGVDFGESFGRITNLEFGLLAQYYPDAIQIMEPNRLVFEGNQPSVERGEGFDAQTLFLTPTITLKFGGMW
ncbi:MAG: hypothetical protein ACOC2C_01200 [Cyclonatronaceae bacterium]